jgi:hypothetical protein
MGVSSISGGSVAVPAVAVPTKSGTSVVAPPKSEPPYTVQLSGGALAKSLKHQGQNPTQIAQQMGLDVKTVDSYLNIKSATPTTVQSTAKEIPRPIPTEPCWVTDIVSSSALS